MAGLYPVIHVVLIVQGYRQILDNRVEVGLEDVGNVIQLATNIAG